jgi:pyridoxamine 5'-phosphate oxidase
VNIAQLRTEYMRAALDESSVADDPFRQFERWFEEALASELREPNAMTLATVGPKGRPSARIVLLKGFDSGGFVFFTNYSSRKGRDLALNSSAAVLFFWPELERQVRIEGAVAEESAAVSDEYFATRPQPSQLGAWASPQSDPIQGRAELEARLAEVEKRLEMSKGAIPRPPRWGGYRLIPETFEFWQGRPSRLHDRIRYRRIGDLAAPWLIDRLAP